MESATDRLKNVMGRIDKAAQRAGRDPKDITLVAVTKTVSFDKVLPYFHAGIGHFGENRLQAAVTKYAEFRTKLSFPQIVSGNPASLNIASATGSPITTSGMTIRPAFHLIGPLQSNKAKKAVAFFDLIQTLDRWELAVDLDRHARDTGKIQDCLVQIKISDELTKSGLDPSALPEFLEKLKALPHLRIQGLMGIPPLSATGEASRPYFQRLRRLYEETPFSILSMGMSSDFEVAIEEGSTMVRLGTALFGSRVK